MVRFLLASLFVVGYPCLAQGQGLGINNNTDGYIARIQLHTAEELMGFLRRAEMLQQKGDFKVGEDLPVVFVLHGAEAESLLISSYIDNKELADLAARLTAFKVVDIKVCETWLGGKHLDSSQLQPFIDTVPYGPAEQERLIKQRGYVYF